MTNDLKHLTTEKLGSLLAEHGRERALAAKQSDVFEAVRDHAARWPTPLDQAILSLSKEEAEEVIALGIETLDESYDWEYALGLARIGPDERLENKADYVIENIGRFASALSQGRAM